MKNRKALVLGGNRFFGRHLTQHLLKNGYEVTLFNRGTLNDGFGSSINRIRANRDNTAQLNQAIQSQTWDFIFDQICYTATDVKRALPFLKNFSGKYIFTSSQAVYDYGVKLDEANFNAKAFTYSAIADRYTQYAEAKRQAEAEFSKAEPLNCLMVRLPYVIGTDDYTARLDWHIKKCLREEPIYIPHPDIRFCFVDSSDAGLALYQLAESRASGPINAANPGDISFSELLSLIESICGKKFLLSPKKTEQNATPYFKEASMTLNLDKMQEHKIKLPPLAQWLPKLIENLMTKNREP